MLKKSLVAIAVAGALAGGASAADVTLYGIVDSGLAYSFSDTDNFDGTNDDADGLELVSGYNSSSRFGLKGTEDLGNGLKVSFKLENGFSSDTGTMGQNGRLFGREASLTLAGAFGQVSFGRMGGVGSSAGTYDLVYGTADAFDGGANGILGLTISDRYDNMFAYQTPEFGGFKATVQYSFQRDSKTEGREEGTSNADRYASAALTGAFGPVNVVAAYELLKQPAGALHDDTNIVYLGGNFDAGFATLFAMAQYAKGQETFGSAADPFSDVASWATDITYADNAARWDGIDSYGLHFGAVAPIGNGDLTVALYYADGDTSSTQASYGNATYTGSADMNYLGLAARYGYNLSKRTTLYVGAGFSQTKTEVDYMDANKTAGSAERKEKIGHVYAGLKHTF